MVKLRLRTTTMSGTSFMISAIILLTGYYAEGLRTKMVCEYEMMNIECLDDQSISIKSVEFGRKNGIYCNTNNLWTSRVTNCTTLTRSYNTVVDKCHHKRSCTISAESYTLGDPCAYVQKYLEVGYECEEGPLKKQFACELETLTISCPNNKKIAINDATFGRTDPTKCIGPTNIVNTNVCRSPNSTTIMASRCDGKQTCSVSATSSIFGDPCTRINKYLEVKYICQ